MNIFYIIAIVLVIAWVGGFALQIGGNLIHILLVIALVVFIYKSLTKSK